MVKDTKISTIQMTLLIMGFIYGSTAIMNPAAGAKQDAWLAFMIGWGGGFILITIYTYISLLYPEKTLIDILKDTFGKYLGTIIGFAYIWYFLHLGSLVLRNFGEFINIVTLPNTPMIVVISSFIITISYAVRNGIEVLSRASELVVPLLTVFVILLFFLLIREYNLKEFLPILEDGLRPVILSAFGVLTFPFGELVAFLMVFNCINKPKNLLKISYTGVATAGLIILSVILRDTMVLGGEMLKRVTFPPHLSTKLIPIGDIDPLVAVNLMFGGGIKVAVCLYCVVLGLAQLIGQDDYKPFVLPTAALMATISIWVYESVFEMLEWATKIWPYYSIPFQIIIPLLILIITLVKRNMKYR